MSRIDAQVAFYESALWEADQSYAAMTAEQKKIHRLLEQEFVRVHVFQPVLIYVADYYLPSVKLMIFSAWEEHEHGEAYFRELCMKQEVEAQGYKVLFYTQADRENPSDLVERVRKTQ